jgi:hypothetical protein
VAEKPQRLRADRQTKSPLAAFRLTALGFLDHLTGSSFTATGLEPDRPRSVWFLNDQRTLGHLLTLPGLERGPITVTLQPCGTLVGRLVDAEGHPKSNSRVAVVIRAQPLPMGHENIKSDAEGRFRTAGLATGLKYGLVGDDGSELVKDISVRIGEVKDLGDLKFIPSPGE